MPKLEISEHLLSAYMGKKYPPEDLEALLPIAKAELDSVDHDNGIIKVEFNDTNRPDLWSAAGLARQLKSHLNGESSRYDFFSEDTGITGATPNRINVDHTMETVRPYIAAFAAEGPAVDDVFLAALIQSQEKLCTNYGRKRQSIAMGIYSGARIEFPITYRGAQPDETHFVPLESSSSMSLREIIEKHPKGIEYGPIISGFDLFPYLEDARGNCLSLPPIINSNHCGAVAVGEKRLFIELTGTDMDSVLTATSIMACDMSDAGYRIMPVHIAYPYDTPHGRDITTPYYFQGRCSTDIPYVCKILGETFSTEEISQCLSKMGHAASIEGETISIAIPPYRNDFMHGADIVEEIMIGRGLASFGADDLDDFTIGRLSPTEQMSRAVRNTMVGMGYQEMLYNYLGSKDDFVEKMGIDGTDTIEIANPMTENYQVVRNSVLPNLLNSTSVSRNAPYPHKIFEIGNTVSKQQDGPSGTRTATKLGVLLSDTVAGFNEINAHIAALMFYLNIEAHLRDSPDTRFIGGRCVNIRHGDESIGVMGELHPEILENWNIEMPCAAAELDIGKIGR